MEYNNNYRLLENEEEENNNKNKKDSNNNLKDENNYLINNSNEVPEANNYINNNNNPIDFIIDNFGDKYITKLILDFFLIHPTLKFLLIRNKKILNLYSKKKRENFNKISLCIIVFCLFIIGFKINNNGFLISLFKFFLIFLLFIQFFILNKNFIGNRKKCKGNFD